MSIHVVSWLCYVGGDTFWWSAGEGGGGLVDLSERIVFFFLFVVYECFFTMLREEFRFSTRVCGERLRWREGASGFIYTPKSSTQRRLY